MKRTAVSLALNIAARKSVRAYLDKGVNDNDVQAVVEAGRWAPNHGEFHLAVVRNPEVRRRLNDTAHKAMKESGVEFLQMRAALPGYQPLYGAPVVILVSGPPGSPSTVINCSLAACNMLLQATELGLGSCFVVTPALALRADDTLAGEAGIPEGHEFVCAVLVGHSAPTDPFSNPEREPKGSVGYVD